MFVKLILNKSLILNYDIYKYIWFNKEIALFLRYLVATYVKILINKNISFKLKDSNICETAHQ